MTTDQIVTYILGIFGFTSVSAFLSWLVRNALTKLLADIKGQMTPNGGGSFYDQVAKLSTEVKTLREEVKGLKDKVDAIILSTIPKG